MTESLPSTKLPWWKTCSRSFRTLAFEPGDHAEYTNIGYMVLGAIIEKVTGQAYEDYIRENVLEPLGMKHTDFLYTRAMEPYEAAGSHPLFDKWAPLIPFLGASYVREIYGNHVWLKRAYNDQTPPSGLIGPADRCCAPGDCVPEWRRT